MTASLKLSWKVTSHPLVKEATKSLNASSKPKQIFNKKYSPERGTSTGTCSKAELGVDIKAWAGQSCCLKGQGLGGGICHGPALSHLSPHSATRPHYLSMLMEQKGRSTSKQKSLTWNSTSLLCSSSIPRDLSHVIWWKVVFPPKLYFESRSQQWQHQKAIWEWNWRAVR